MYMLQPTIGQRFESYQNYVELFNLIIGIHPIWLYPYAIYLIAKNRSLLSFSCSMSSLGSSEPIDVELPNQWLWDIVDEFIYQVR